MNIKTYLDYEVILANTAQPVCFTVRCDAPRLNVPRPKPGAFCVVLDRSGSMSGAPLEKARHAAALAVRNLRAEDQFGLVVFDDEAQVLVPLQQATDKQAILSTIQQIHTRGSTNLTAGWSLGRDELKKSNPECARRLLLLSDGLLNVGITAPDQVKQLVAAGLENQAVRTSCLGFGNAYNEDLMTALAQATGGQFYDADTPEKMPAIFASELDGLQKITVQNLRIRLKALRFCDRLEQMGVYPAVTLPGGETEFMVGDLVSEEMRILCFKLDVLPLPWVQGQPVVSLAGEELLEMQLLWDEISETGIDSRQVTQTIRIQATVNADEVRVQTESIPWLSMQQAGKAIDEVTRQLDMGNFDAALRILQDTLIAFRKYGSDKAVAEAVQRLNQMLQQVQTGDFDTRHRKSSKYLSHSYRRMSSKEHWSGDANMPDFKKMPPPPPDEPKAT
jgi:Ca-activated chloride channel family protein